MSDTLYNLVMLYGKMWFDLTLKEKIDALEVYIYGVKND